MTTVNIYLNFDGTCEAAFQFYKSVFGGDFSHFSRHTVMFPGANEDTIREKELNRVLHVALPISNETCIMGNDVAPDWSRNLRVGNNCNISINVDSRQEADRLFNTLSEGGNITMPMAVAFWGAYFGMFIDRFGIHWLVNFDETPQ